MVSTVNDNMPSSESLVPSLLSTESQNDEDYVYDVFYQRQSTLQEMYTPSSSVSGNIATL